MLMNGGERRPVRLSKLAHRRRSLRQAFKYPPPGRIGECVKRPVQFIRLLKHALKYHGSRRYSSKYFSMKLGGFETGAVARGRSGGQFARAWCAFLAFPQDPLLKSRHACCLGFRFQARQPVAAKLDLVLEGLNKLSLLQFALKHADRQQRDALPLARYLGEASRRIEHGPAGLG